MPPMKSCPSMCSSGAIDDEADAWRENGDIRPEQALIARGEAVRVSCFRMMGTTCEHQLRIGVRRPDMAPMKRVDDGNLGEPAAPVTDERLREAIRRSAIPPAPGRPRKNEKGHGKKRKQLQLPFMRCAMMLGAIGLTRYDMADSKARRRSACQRRAAQERRVTLKRSPAEHSSPASVQPQP